MPQIIVSRVPRLRGVQQPIWPLVDPTHPINKGLTGYWPLAGQSVGLTPDGSGFGNDGVITSGSLRDGLNGGNALSFNGSSSKVVIPANAAIVPSPGIQPRTFSCWINQTSTAALKCFFSYGNASVTGSFFAIYNNANGAGDIYVAGNNADNFIATGLLTANNWYHVAVVYVGGNPISAGNVLIYINGASKAVTPAGGGAAGGLATVSTPLHIGEDLTTPGREWSGGIENFRQYNRALSFTEIQLLYGEPYAGIVDAAWSRTGVVITTNYAAFSIPQHSLSQVTQKMVGY